MRPPVALTIAGSDSGGGAGIQADLRTFAAMAVHGTTAITAVTAQNTLGVSGYVEVPLPMIREQIDRVVEDLHPSAAKTGMLASPEIIRVVAGAIREHGLQRLVVDPVMVAKGGARLLQEDAVEALRSELIPLALVLTPNLPEAEVLLGHPISSRDERATAAGELLALGPRAVVLKGGHSQDDADDAFAEPGRLTWLCAPRIATANTHGSGCTFSAAIVAGLAHGLAVAEAVAGAKAFITGAIADSLELGGGHGPVNAMWRMPRT